MPTAVERIQELTTKIAAAKLENAKFLASLEDDTLPGGSWTKSLKDNCFTTWSATSAKPTSWPSGIKVPASDCSSVWDIISTRRTKIATNNIDIAAWQGEIDELRKDPSVITDLEDAENRRTIYRYLTYAGIAVVIILVLVFVYVKWLRKYF